MSEPKVGEIWENKVKRAEVAMVGNYKGTDLVAYISDGMFDVVSQKDFLKYFPKKGLTEVKVGEVWRDASCKVKVTAVFKDEGKTYIAFRFGTRDEDFAVYEFNLFIKEYPEWGDK